jgi:hypothetical protein
LYARRKIPPESQPIGCITQSKKQQRFFSLLVYGFFCFYIIDAVRRCCCCNFIHATACSHVAVSVALDVRPLITARVKKKKRQQSGADLCLIVPRFDCIGKSAILASRCIPSSGYSVSWKRNCVPLLLLLSRTSFFFSNAQCLKPVG